MKIVCESLLDEYRRKKRCEWCGTPSNDRAHPHHYKCRGLGGGHQLDLCINIVALCPTCHAKAHGGQIARHKIGLILAVRYDAMLASIEEALNFIANSPTKLRKIPSSRSMGRLSSEARRLVIIGMRDYFERVRA